jgi:mannose-6-phosphate isomerase-like protein (cupin superfamily)
MKFQLDLKKLAKENEAFRTVLDTGKFAQLVLMALPKGEHIGEEVHDTTDQIFYFVDGKGEFMIDGKWQPIEKGEACFVPAGLIHDIRNIGTAPLKLFTVYAPPMHQEGLIQKTKPEEHTAVRR